jgi:hypothetical protein
MLEDLQSLFATTHAPILTASDEAGPAHPQLHAGETPCKIAPRTPRSPVPARLSVYRSRI